MKDLTSQLEQFESFKIENTKMITGGHKKISIDNDLDDDDLD